MIKLLLAENQNDTHYGVKAILEKLPGIEIVTEVNDARLLTELLLQGSKPDVMLVNFNLFQPNELLNQVLIPYPAVCTILLFNEDNIQDFPVAIKAGYTACLLQTAHADEIIFAINQVKKGFPYISSKLFLNIIDQVVNQSVSNTAIKNKLTNREIEVLALISEGYTNGEIAEKLFTSKRTVEGHRQNLIDKTDSKNTAALIRYAIKNNIIN